jgi:hypothetical protein
MQFNSIPVSTLYVRANFKRIPYKNEIISFRIVCHTYEEFTSNKALMLVDTDPDVVNLQQLDEITESLRIKANALKVVVKMPHSVYKKLAKRENVAN